MSASLVGSEMCIRDRTSSDGRWRRAASSVGGEAGHRATGMPGRKQQRNCLLYTSDAADDM
eukprot:253478-Alexandrium_andersonii.AAC.1